MIYLVTNQGELFKSNKYTLIGVNESIEILKKCKRLQYDSETNGLDCHINKITSIQFGSKEYDFQMVIDASTVDILKYKEVLENTLIIGQNLKFDLQFLYNYKIIPRRVYDVMIAEQLRYLGYPSGFISYGLDAIANRYLDITIDKSIRKDFSWRGLDTETILYAAKDVQHLEDIRDSQIKYMLNNKMIKALVLEMQFVPSMAYLEWGGIKLSVEKWQAKMQSDSDKLTSALEELNSYIYEKSKTDDFFSQYFSINRQGDLFTGFDLTPICTINWKSSPQVVKIAKKIGFDTKVKDDVTGSYKNSVKEDVLKKQKGIDDKFLELLFEYAEHYKTVSTYGQSYLNAINPNTGRIHTQFRQLGTSSGRLACGASRSFNKDLAKLKGLPYREVFYPQLQNLPRDATTRNSFVSEEGNLMVSADYSGMEARLGAAIYNDPNMLHEFLHGSGDIHSLVAKAAFPELKDKSVKEIKKDYPDKRQEAKPVGFSVQFGGSEYAISEQLGCSLIRAKEILDGYNNMFTGIAEFKVKGSRFVRNNGYIIINEVTGHRVNWYDWKYWKQRNEEINWDEYRKLKASGMDHHPLIREVRNDSKKASFYDRLALNAPTQGTGAIILKKAVTTFFDYIVDNNLFGKVFICNLVHDEIVVEYPENLTDIPNILSKIMEDSAFIYCKRLPIPAEPSVGKFWMH